MSRRLGLIIGVNQYQDSALRPLNYAENDARALAQWLVNTKGGNWSPAHVQHVQGAHVTKELVESLISQMCLQIAEPDDLALIYFAGHAFVDDQSGDGYLALSDTTIARPATGLHLVSFANHVLTRSRAGHILLILDCFQNGRSWTTRRSSMGDAKPLLGPALLQLLQQHPNRLIMCSCRGNEKAPETGERNIGFFIHRMIVGLCGPAIDAQTGTSTLQQLHSYLFSALGEQQRPQLFGNGQTPLYLVGSPPEPSTPPAAAPSMTPPMQMAGKNTNGSLKSQSMASATATLTGTSPNRNTSGQLVSPSVEQQCQQLLAQAQQLTQEQQFQNALDVLDRILRLNPASRTALIMKGQILGTLGRVQDAQATVEELLKHDPQSALGWSMQAVLLNNTGQYQTALNAIERSLELDANNPESYAIKNNIMASMAMVQSRETPKKEQKQETTQPAKGIAVFLGIIIQIVSFSLGSAGLALLILMPHLPALIGLGLISLSLALLCVNAWRGSYRYGAVYLIPNLFITLVAGGLLAGLYKFGYQRVLVLLKSHYELLIPMLFLVIWLAVVALVPFILSILGSLAGALTRKRR